MVKPLLKCNGGNTCSKKGPQTISECLCHLVWAEGTETDNAYCKRLTTTETDDITKLSALALKNKLPTSSLSCLSNIINSDEVDWFLVRSIINAKHISESAI